jgi:cobaltochelatase CobN
VGTHGTLEWLPGKEIGLSGDCYPDIAIGALPNIYPYNIGVTGEGMQAKRRSYAALIGHMIPSMTDGGTYGELAELEEKIDEWYDARLGDRGKLPTLFDEIWELAVRQNLTTDLNVAEKPEGREQLTFTENLHLWISRIKSSSVRDGLHIMGRIPEPEQFKNMCRLLVRVANNDVPSIRQGVAALHGLDADRLMDEPAALRDDGRTNAMLLSELDREGGEIFDRLMEADYDPAGIPELLKACGDGGNTEKLEKCLRFVCDKVAPSLKLVTDELRFFSKGIAGEFIMPGPSGNPSRGTRKSPNRKDFYSSDPARFPAGRVETGGILAHSFSQSAEGQRQASESVAIILYPGENEEDQATTWRRRWPLRRAPVGWNTERCGSGNHTP